MGERRAGRRTLGLPAIAGRSLVPLALLLALLGRTAGAEPLTLRVGRIGEVVAQEAGPPEPPRPGNVVGSTPVFAPRFVKLGPNIDGTFCRQFGLEFQAVNLAPGAESVVTVQLRHPLWTLPDGRTSLVETNLSDVSGDRWTYSGYTLEEPWALVPGTWTFVISQGPRVLGTANFNVTVEGEQREPVGGCTSLTS